METAQEESTGAKSPPAPFTPPENAWLRDLFIIAAAWFAVRVPLIVFRVKPFVQCDSFNYPTFFNAIRIPHYPFMYGQFLECFGHFPAMLIQHFLVLFCAVILYFIGRDISGRNGGLFSGLFVSVYGGFVLYAHSIMSETLFNFFVVCHLAVLWMALKEEKARSKWCCAWFFLAGFLASVASNVRPVIQYQVFVIFLALFPFYLARRQVKSLLKFSGWLALGFLSLHLYVAGATYTHYGLFGISSGLPKAAMYRLVYDSKAPLSGVRVSDPKLAAVRDYLVQVGPDDKNIWVNAFNHITGEILPKFNGNRCVYNIETDRVIMELWRKYVLTYPFEYFRYSVAELVLQLLYVEKFSGLLEFSQRMSKDGPPPPSSRAVSFLRAFYLLFSSMLGNIFFIIFGITAGFLFMRRENDPKNYFMACLFLTMFFLYVPQFFASLGMIRYRYPFDMVFFLAAGAGFSRLSLNSARKRAMSKIAPGGGK